MRVSRSVSVIVLLASLTVIGSNAPIQGQAASVDSELKPYLMQVDPSPVTSTRVRQMKDARLRIAGPDYKQNVKFLEEFAQHMVFKVTQPKYYYSGSDTGVLLPRPTSDTLDSVFRELDDYMIRPTAENVGKMSVDNADYIKEFGAALDQAVQAVMKKNPPPIIRVNAARMLAFAARSGAPAHAKTITALLNDPKTPPEVLLYAYKAAEGFLGAYDPYAVGRVDANRHCAKEDDLIPLIKALESQVIPGPQIAEHVAESSSIKPPTNPKAPPTPGGVGRLDSGTLTPEQVAVVQYFRRVTGPSKTADIQQVLAFGAHGPKALVIVLVNDLEVSP